MFNEGARFTSISQGVKLSSIRISNPSKAKQFFLCGAFIFVAGYIADSAEIIVLIIISFILLQIGSNYIPALLK